MYVRLPPDIHEAVRLRAIEEDRSMAQVVRKALRRYLTEVPR